MTKRFKSFCKKTVSKYDVVLAKNKIDYLVI